MAKIINGKLADDNGVFLKYEEVEIVPDSIFTPAEYEFKQEAMPVCFQYPSLWERLKWRIYYWWYKETHSDDMIRIMNEVWLNQVSKVDEPNFIIVGPDSSMFDELCEKIENKETELMYHLNTEYFKDGQEEDASGGEDTQSEAEKEYPKQNND